MRIRRVVHSTPVLSGKPHRLVEYKSAKNEKDLEMDVYKL